MTIYDYAKLTKEEKESLINDEALYLENYRDNGNTINVYYLDEFFIEVTLNKEVVIEIIPYKRGYKMEKKNLHNLAKRNAILSLAA